MFFALRDNERYKDYKIEKRVIPRLIEIKVSPDYILLIMDKDTEHEIILEPEANKIIVSYEKVFMTQEEIDNFFVKLKAKRDKRMEEATKEYQEKHKKI